MSWSYLQEVAGGSTEVCCSDILPFAPSRLSPKTENCSCSASATESCRDSLCGTTCVIYIFVYQCKMGAWTKNTDMAKSANASSAEISSSQGTKEVSKTAAQMLAVGFCKQRKQLEIALFAAKSSFLPGRDTKLVHVNAGQSFACRAGNSTRWLMLGAVLPCSVVRLLQGACGTKPTEQRRLSGIRSRSLGRILRPILSRECHGATMVKRATNGA